jgi:hypothetical protein
VSHAIITLGIDSVIDRAGVEVLGRALVRAAEGIADSL